jgi:ABC-type phosphate transport system auxiliary subunit
VNLGEKLMSNIKNIADILPEGLDESTVEQIFQLVDSTINEQVAEKIGVLEARVTAYVRTKIDDLKEHALAELSEENEVYRNARLFESVRTLMSLELNSEDEDSALAVVTTENGELQEEFDVLQGQVNALVEENQRLENTVRLMDKKVSIAEGVASELETEKAQLLEEVENLEAAKEEAFVSSEKAVVVSMADMEVNEERTQTKNNEFLTDEVMKFMPFSS